MTRIIHEPWRSSNYVQLGAEMEKRQTGANITWTCSYRGRRFEIVTVKDTLSNFWDLGSIREVERGEYLPIGWAEESDAGSVFAPAQYPDADSAADAATGFIDLWLKGTDGEK
jgi:hypothetical protein